MKTWRFRRNSLFAYVQQGMGGNVIGQSGRNNPLAGKASLSVQVSFAWGRARLCGMRVLKGKEMGWPSQVLQLGLQFSEFLFLPSTFSRRMGDIRVALIWRLCLRLCNGLSSKCSAPISTMLWNIVLQDPTWPPCEKPTTTILQMREPNFRGVQLLASTPKNTALTLKGRRDNSSAAKKEWLWPRNIDLGYSKFPCFNMDEIL